MAQPDFSVIIPVRDGAGVIEHAVASIQNQSIANIEIIVIDDESRDDTQAILRDIQQFDTRVVVIRTPVNVGPAVARNLGMDVARGRYLAFLDGDDVAVAHRLLEQQKYLEEHPDVAAVGSAVQLFGAQDGIVTPALSPELIAARMIFSCEFFMPSMTIRTEEVRRRSLQFKAEFGLTCDWEFFQVLLRGARMANLAEPLTKYRRWDRQLTVLITDTLDCPASKLRAEHLQWLGIDEAQQDLAAHIACAPCYWPLRVEIPHIVAHDDVSRWLAKISDTNRRTKKIAAGALSDTLDRVWAWWLQSAGASLPTSAMRLDAA